MDEEGWFVDPCGIHDARSFTEGSATALVRDHRVESHDPPPKPDRGWGLTRALVALPGVGARGRESSRGFVNP